jgi:hypothetical protein
VDRYDVRDLILQDLRRRHAKLNERVSPIRFDCVIKKHSSKLTGWLGDGAWGCHACGIDGQPLATLARELGIDVPKTGGFTVEEYADRKRFSLSHLTAWGVHTADGKFGNVVAIPYRDADGALLRTKHRTRRGTFWHDDGSGTHLYGLDKLAKHATAPVILVEGESDCHAAWHHDVLAIGLPGAGAWKSDWAPLFVDRQVYVWQEPGEAGAKMVRSLAADLPHARVIDNQGIKDFAELHAHVGGGFKAAVAARIADAYPIDRQPPAVIFDALVGATLDRIKARKLEPIDAVPTMIPTWNSHCRDAGGGVGLARSWHITIGAKSGRGKSLMALNLAANAARLGERVCYISLEMTQEQLTTRIAAIASGVSIREIEQGSQFSTITWSAAANVLNGWYEETGGCVLVNRHEISSLDDVVASMRYEHEVHGCRYMIVDYLQLAKATAASQRENDILHQMTVISGTIRRTARDLNVVSVALSQLNRQTSANNDHPPTPEGLMGGSPLENDSDQVLLLDHSNWERGDDHAITRLLIGKNRHGGTSEIPVKVDYRCLRLTELQVPQSAADTPGPAVATYILSTPPGSDDRGEAAEPETVTEEDLQFPAPL